MSKTLALVHTVSRVATLFDELVQELLPELDRFHIVDESLLRLILEAEGLTPEIYRRVCEDVVAAENAGADLVMVTCSSSSPCVDVARSMVSVPVLKVDELMADQAVSLGRRIGVLATAPTTIGPTTDLIRARARAAAKRVEVDSVLCRDAYAAMLAGDTERHDEILRENLRRLMTDNDVVILAQASMAGLVDDLPESNRPVPVLSSPRTSLEWVRDHIE